MIFEFINFIVLVVGVGLLIAANFMDRTSSFDNASFMNEMVIGVVGVMLVGAAIVFWIIQLAYVG